MPRTTATVRATVECSQTIARFTLAYLDETALQAFTVCRGATLRDLSRFGIQRIDVERMRIAESRDFLLPIPTDRRARSLLLAAMPDAARAELEGAA